MLERDVGLWWYAFLQANSIVRYDQSTLDLMREAGMFCALIGAETGDADTMRAIGKHSSETDNVAAAKRMSDSGIFQFLFYIMGFPDEDEESMLNTIDECRRVAAYSPLSRPTVWPFRPIPGTALYPRSLELGFPAPATLEDWGTFLDYHCGTADSWPGQISARVDRTRRLFEHFYTLSLGLARGRIGWWERRAARRIQKGDLRLGRVEAKAFDLASRLGSLLPGWKGDILPGVQTSQLLVQHTAR
jgi:hypothetical protein